MNGLELFNLLWCHTGHYGKLSCDGAYVITKLVGAFGRYIFDDISVYKQRWMIFLPESFLNISLADISSPGVFFIRG